MADQKKRYTVEECLQILDDNFDIPGEGFESDIEDVDDDDFESLEPDMTGSLRNTTGNTFQFQNLGEGEDEGPDRVSKMDIDFNDSHVEVQEILLLQIMDDLPMFPLPTKNGNKMIPVSLFQIFLRKKGLRKSCQ